MVPDGTSRELGFGWGAQVLVFTWSYGYSDMTIARYDLGTNEFKMSTLPYGGGIGFVVVDRNMMEP